MCLVIRDVLCDCVIDNIIRLGKAAASIEYLGIADTQTDALCDFISRIYGISRKMWFY